MISLTALILTKDEEANIERTLHALGWADKIVIVDSFSTDRTVEIARATHRRAEILERQFDTHANQWNFGLAQIQTEWVLTLDADYEVSAELALEIQRLDPPAEIAGYEAQFEYRINGRALRASVYPPRIVLFRPNDCSYYDDGHTQRLRVKGALGHLKFKIYHDDRKPCARWLQAQRKYVQLEARQLRKQPFAALSALDKLRRMIFFAAPAMFFYTLLVQGLILDGRPGWIYVWQRTIAEALLSKELLLGSDRQ
jgi:glycosyltransferase involved in cell wall biosynthesis